MIHVAGGTYLERCREPAWDFLFGSGLRAAAQLTALGAKVRLHTAIADRERPLLESHAAQFGVGVVTTPVSKTIAFDYDHGLSTPIFVPDPRHRDYGASFPTIAVKADRVVCFGMIEASLNIIGGQVVYDPQSPTAPNPFHANGTADRLAIIANRSELTQLAGTGHVEAACRKILRNERADVVVAKLGPSGCLVVRKNKATCVPAFRTQTVFPIGSGDVFSAAFGKRWLDEGDTPERAALFASRATALYCQSQTPRDHASIKAAKLKPLRMLPISKRKQVYLAGPFFNAGQRWLIEELREALLNCGVRVFSPFHDVGPGDADAVYKPDMDGLRASKVVLACLDGLDTGTIYEIGYAHAHNHHVVVLVGSERMEDLKMMYGGGCQIVDDVTTAVYLTAWAASCE